MLPHAVDDFAHLLRRTLLIGVHRPEEQFLHPEISRQVGKRAFARHQPPPLHRNLFQLHPDRPFDLRKLRRVGRCVRVIGRRIRRIERHQRLADILHVNDRVARRHPRVRIWFPDRGPFRNAHRSNPLREHRTRHALQIAEEAHKPPLEIQSVPQHEVSFLRLHDVLRCRLVTMDFRARLRDRFDDRGITRDVLRHVLDNRKRRHDTFLRRRPITRDQPDPQSHRNQAECSRRSPCVLPTPHAVWREGRIHGN